MASDRDRQGDEDAELWLTIDDIGALVRRCILDLTDSDGRIDRARVEAEQAEYESARREENTIPARPARRPPTRMQRALWGDE
jgi:hypothetical protein